MVRVARVEALDGLTSLSDLGKRVCHGSVISLSKVSLKVRGDMLQT
jgi:hypothetical protein